MKSMVIILGIISILVLSACTTQEPQAGPETGDGKMEQPVLEGCGAIPTLKVNLENTKVTLDEEQKELLMEKEPRIQRRQKFKVMKLDREVKNLMAKVAGLQTNCS